MTDVNPEYGPPDYDLLREGDRRFALSAQLLIPEFGDSVITKAKAGQFLAEATDGAIQLFSDNNFRVPGWTVEVPGRKKFRLNPGALITPKNIVSSKVTSGVISAALEHVGDGYNDQVDELLNELGVQGEDPIQAKDTHAFGFVMRPKNSSFGKDLGVMALLDARIGGAEAPRFSSIKDMMTYFEEDLGGYVLSHLRLKGLIDRILDIPDINPNRSGSIVDTLSEKYHCYSPDEPLPGRAKKINGVILKKSIKNIGGLVTLEQLQNEYPDLEDLRIPKEPKVQISVPSKKPQKNSKKDTLDVPKSKKEVNNGKAIQEVIDAIKATLDGLNGTNIDLGFYKEQIKAAVKKGDIEDLRFIAAELESTRNK